jgi:hypothetical protein
MERAQMSGWFRTERTSSSNSAARTPGADVNASAKQADGGARIMWSRQNGGTGHLDWPHAALTRPVGSPLPDGMVSERVATRSAAREKSPFPEPGFRGTPTGGPLLSEFARTVATGDAADFLAGPTGSAEPTREAAGAASHVRVARHAPLRLHAEASPAGHTVWIALRADDGGLLNMLPQIVLDLQRGFAQRGHRLLAVVCNGREVWREPSTATFHFKEP